MTVTVEAVHTALAQVLDPEIQRPLTELGMVGEIHIEGDHGKITVILTTPACPLRARIEEDVIRAARGAGLQHVEVVWDAKVLSRVISAEDPIPSVANVILVMSGKGGVGKSTVATNLTMALHRSGCRVGLLDADIYGPSIPTMLGVAGRPFSRDGKRIEPLQRFGVKLMSIGFLLEDPTAAVIWRGPMLHGALLQFLRDVDWGTLDYLVLDLPPGTGDVTLTLAQRVKATGAVIVTTPQEVALQDVYKSVSMCKKVEVPVLGVIENMSYFEDPSGLRHHLFGEGGGAKIAAFAGAPLLGQLPLDPKIREWGDAGTPIVQANPGAPISLAFRAIAERLADRISVINAAELGSELVIDRSGGTGPRRLPVLRHGG